MTRAEIRRQKRQEEKADRIYHVTKAQLDKIVADATDKALDKLMFERLEQNITVMMSLPLVSLHDRFGFGPVRCLRFFRAVMVKWDIMHEDFDRLGADDTYDFKTFMKLCKDEVGIDLDAEIRKER